jgi:hypothetical protein
MDVHASPASLPELDAFLSTFKVRFRRPEARASPSDHQIMSSPCERFAAVQGFS